MAMISFIVLLIIAAVIVVSVVRKKCIKPIASNSACYTIQAKKGSSMMIKDSGYIINSIGHFVGEGSKNGLDNIDVCVDLRYTKASAVYKALGALENEEGIKVSTKETSNPTAIIFNVKWAKLPGTTF